LGCPIIFPVVSYDREEGFIRLSRHLNAALDEPDLGLGARRYQNLCFGRKLNHAVLLSQKEVGTEEALGIFLGSRGKVAAIFG